MVRGFMMLGLLQLMDARSTLTAIDASHVERNPLLAPFSNTPGATIGAKAATTAGTVVLAEKLWRRHPVKAVVAMAAINAAYAAIVSANDRMR